MITALVLPLVLATPMFFDKLLLKDGRLIEGKLIDGLRSVATHRSPRRHGVVTLESPRWTCSPVVHFPWRARVRVRPHAITPPSSA